MSEEDFLQQLKLHQGIIFKLVSLYASNAEEKKDCYQEIVLQAWKSYPNFRREAQFSTWLYKIALFTLLTMKRKNSPLDYPGSMEPYTNTATTEPFEKDGVAVLRWALRKLPETDRSLISLHLDGYSNGEIAAIAGISPNHVAVKLHRIKQQLSILLKQME